ncbi:hypothetical protein C8F04DRAFT_1387734 [Mycena alexandri]|uniref:DUF6533 domain-containing protein n=1 Tax=Mycena alexandri TaxID=1745969 RepID=A0AAD6TGB9_9AGAR|nr:hypothetical protein C8F04DRAFT_1387734 [Mycena alexandri]
MDRPAPLPPALITAFTHLQASKYYDLAVLVMLVYDYALTLEVEITQVWRRSNWSLPKIMFFLFRYLTPIFQLGSICADQLTTWTPASCGQWLWWRIIVDELITVATSVVLILRVYALLRRAKWALGLMLSAMVAQIIIAFWSFPASTHAPLPPGVTGCYIGPKTLTDVGRIASLFDMLLVLDTIIFGLTAYHVFRSKRSVAGMATPLTEIMIRDGFLYFSVIFFVNLGNIIVIELSSIPEDLRPVNVEFTPAITVVMVSRLFLNMRRQATAPVYKGAHPRLTATLLGDLDDTAWTPKSQNFTLPTETTNTIELQSYLPKVED